MKDFLAVMPSILWLVFWVVVLLAFGRDFRKLIAALTTQLKLARFQVGPIELDPKAAAETVFLGGEVVRAPKLPPVRIDEDKRRGIDRENHYARNRRLALVHKLFLSQEPGQLYDILLYVVPAHRGTLAGVERIEYYFGGSGWKHQIFPATDRSRGFPLLTAAYGPLLCTAEVFFTDGASAMLYRFIDFEMGIYAPERPYQPDTGAADSPGASS